jgi:hypothetical protein
MYYTNVDRLIVSEMPCSRKLLSKWTLYHQTKNLDCKLADSIIKIRNEKPFCQC